MLDLRAVGERCGLVRRVVARERHSHRGTRDSVGAEQCGGEGGRLGVVGAEGRAAFWGCLLRGAGAVPMDDGATAEFAARVARETSARLMIAERGRSLPGVAIPLLRVEDLAGIAGKNRGVSTPRVPGASPR